MLGVILLGSFVFFGSNAQVSASVENKRMVTARLDGKAIFNQALNDYFSDRNSEAQLGYERLEKTEFAAISAVPAAVNLVALGKYNAANKKFLYLRNSTDAREREYAQLWVLWLTAKLWKGNSKDLKKELTYQYSSQPWNEGYMKTIAEFYAGRKSLESVFNAVSVLHANAAQEKDALTEAVFFAGGYLQNVKHDQASAKQLFNDNLNKLNSVSLERPFIDRESAALNKLTHQSK